MEGRDVLACDSFKLIAVTAHLGLIDFTATPTEHFSLPCNKEFLAITAI